MFLDHPWPRLWLCRTLQFWGVQLYWNSHTKNRKLLLWNGSWIQSWACSKRSTCWYFSRIPLTSIQNSSLAISVRVFEKFEGGLCLHAILLFSKVTASVFQPCLQTTAELLTGFNVWCPMQKCSGWSTARSWWACNIVYNINSSQFIEDAIILARFHFKRLTKLHLKSKNLQCLWASSIGVAARSYYGSSSFR